MKYKVGDKVRIVSKWGKGCRQNSSGRMDKWLGKVMTIRSVDYVTLSYKMDEDKDEHGGIGWTWFENSIEGFACEKKIVITTNGVEMRARIYDRNKVIKTATAKCSPDDNFSFETGARTAFERLFASGEKEKPKPFNGKVVCVNVHHGFTVDKIYEFVNGQCFDDYKMSRPSCAKCKDLQLFGDAFVTLEEYCRRR